MDNIWVNIKGEKIPSSLEFDEECLGLIAPNSCVLDLGCGNGGLCRKLSAAGYDTYGIDCSVEAINNAKNDDVRSKYFTMDASKLAFESDLFDLVIIKAIFTVIPEASVRREIIKEAYRVLKNHGIIYLADFAQSWWNSTYYQRYIDNYAITGEYGLFKALNSKGQEEYTAKHFSQKEIVDIYYGIGVDTMAFDTVKVRTRSGNLIDGYKILLQKAPKEVKFG